MVDPRLKPGCIVEALVNKSECARQFGSLSRTKTIQGIVFEAVKRKNPTTGRNTNNVIVDFDFGESNPRRKEVSLRTLEKYKAPDSLPQSEAVQPIINTQQEQISSELVTGDTDIYTNMMLNINDILVGLNNDGDDRNDTNRNSRTNNNITNDLMISEKGGGGLVGVFGC